MFCYSNLPPGGDARTLHFRQRAHRFREIHGLSAAAVARLVREDRIDVLVELSGHTSGSRLDVMALRPAPVQATWIGYPNTTGLPEIQYRLTDAVVDPRVDSDGHLERAGRTGIRRKQRFTEELVGLGTCVGMISACVCLIDN